MPCVLKEVACRKRAPRAKGEVQVLWANHCRYVGGNPDCNFNFNRREGRCPRETKGEADLAVYPCRRIGGLSSPYRHRVKLGLARRLFRGGGFCSPAAHEV